MKPISRALAAGLALSALSCNSPSVTDKQIPSVPVNEKVSEDHNSQVFNPTIDILFVVDNSASMDSHQRNLANNVDVFVNEFLKSSIIDYHIGVISTDMDSDSWAGTPCCGKLIGKPKFVERTTPNVATTLAKLIKIGTDGSGTERAFAPIFDAMGVQSQTWNQNFFRKDAFIAVVFITDAEDQSHESAQDLYDFLVKEKKDPAKVLGYGAIIPTGADESRCPRDAFDAPTKIEEFLKLVTNAGKNEFGLCDPDFGQQIAGMGKDIVKKVGGRMKLNRPPVIETIKVMYGTQEIPNDFAKGWTFDPSDNSLYFGQEIQWTTQPPGTTVKIDFKAARYDTKN